VAYRFHPGMRMYQVEWRREGVLVSQFAAHAVDEADIIGCAEDFFAEHPECDWAERQGDTVHVSLVKLRNSSQDTGDAPDS
jgi:hypothetical protein